MELNSEEKHQLKKYNNYMKKLNNAYYDEVSVINNMAIFIKYDKSNSVSRKNRVSLNDNIIKIIKSY
jgi:hypothetical protein